MEVKTYKTTDIIGVVTLILILIFTITYIYIVHNFKYIKENWSRYKCNPLYSPFAGLFQNDPDSKKNLIKAGVRNISSCLWKTSKGFFAILIKPMMFIINIIISLLGKIKTTLDTFRQQLIVIRKMLMQIVKQVMSRLENLVAVFLNTFLKLRDTTKKSLATFKLLNFMLQTTSLSLQSMINGPIGSLAKIAGKYGYLMTYFLLGPISFKMFPSLWLPVFCFNKDFKIKTNQGITEISNIKLGDKIFGGGVVKGIYNFLNLNPQQCLVSDGLISRNHIIYNCGMWKPAGEIYKLYNKKSPTTVHCLSVDNNIIHGKDGIYRDWDEINDNNLECEFKTKILNSLNNSKDFVWDKNHLYQEGFSFRLDWLINLTNTKLGKKFLDNVIIGKAMMSDSRIKWYENRIRKLNFYVSGSTIILDKKSKKWIPVYLSKDFREIKLDKNIVINIVTLTGNIYFEKYVFKDLIEIRNTQFTTYRTNKILEYLNSPTR